MTDLPRGWARSSIHEIADTSLGKMLDAKQATGEHSTPYLRNVNVRWGSFDLNDVASMDIRPEELERVLARNGDVVACEGGEPGRAAVWRRDDPVALQKALHRIRRADGVSPDFLALLLRHQAESGKLAALFTGTTIKHLPQEKLRRVDVPLPPTAEQERIVTAIEEAFSKLDVGEARLRTIRQRLKRMREAVLAAAVTGRLVPQDPTDTPTAKLLADLGAESRESLGGLPAGWAPVELGTLLTGIETGKSFATKGRPAEPGERAVIKVSAMTWGEFRPSENKALPVGTEIDPRWFVRKGDLLVSRANTSEYVGACVLVGADHPELILSDKSLRLVLQVGIESAWLLHVLRSRGARNQIEQLATGTKDSMRNISQAKLRSIRLPLPPTAEQHRIVGELDRQLSFIEACERAVEAGLARSAALRRAVLKAAFEGRLVPQDPSDEPASVLLERIRVERAAADAPKPGRRRRTVETS